MCTRPVPCCSRCLPKQYSNSLTRASTSKHPHPPLCHSTTMQSGGQVADLPPAASGVAGAGSMGSASGSKSQVAPQSPTTSGVVGDGSTGATTGGHVVHHSPPTSGVEGDGSTDSESFGAFLPHEVVIDGFGDLRPIPRFNPKPMRLNSQRTLVQDREAIDEPNSLFVDRRTFFKLSKDSYESMLNS